MLVFRKHHLIGMILLLLNPFILLASSYVTPEQFGARGDGIIDDTKAISLALKDGRPIIFHREYSVHSLIIPSGHKLIGREGAKLNYYEIIIGDGVKIDRIVFDGKWNTKGVHIEGDNVKISRCKFINTRGTKNAFGGLTSAIWIGNYNDISSSHAKYSNITIKQCSFDNCAPVDFPGNANDNASVARFILSYCCDNLIIDNCSFKNIIGVIDSDAIQICGNIVQSNEFPFYCDENEWEGAVSPYKGYYYSPCQAVVKNCHFLQSDSKSSIKVMSSNVKIFNNYYEICNSEKFGDSYSVVRVHYARNVSISKNHIIHVSGGIDNIFKIGVCDGVRIFNNSLESKEEGNIRSILNCSYSSDVDVRNNKCSLSTLSSILSTEYNHSLTIEKNRLIFHGEKMRLYDDIGNHYSYPLSSKKGIIVIKKNQMTTNGSIIDLENKYEYPISYDNNKTVFVE